MRDRVTISLNPRSTTRLTRLSKRKPCSSCAETNSQSISYKSLGFVVVQFIARLNSTHLVFLARSVSGVARQEITDHFCEC